MVTDGMKEIETVTFQHFIIALKVSATTNCQTGHYFKLVISWDRRLDGQAADGETFTETGSHQMCTGVRRQGRMREKSHKYSTMLILITDRMT